MLRKQPLSCSGRALLPERDDPDKLKAMSAAELIEQIKALSPADLEIVREFVLNGQIRSGQGEVRYVSDEGFDQAAGGVFEKHDELLQKLAK